MLITALLVSILTSCIPTVDVGEYLGGMLNTDGETNAETLINTVARDAVLSGVVIRSTHYSGFTKNESQGSGVIYREHGRHFFVLTNYHVVFNESNANSESLYSVVDAYETAHNATLVAYDKGLDLAVLSFVATTEAKERLKVSALAASNPRLTSQILSVGNPSGLHNAISMGKISAIKDVDLDELSIAVIYHTAPLDHGSSGGGLYNTKGELVGINYAIGQDEDGEIKLSFAIPIESVIGFLRTNNILPADTQQ